MGNKEISIDGVDLTPYLINVTFNQSYDIEKEEPMKNTVQYGIYSEFKGMRIFDEWVPPKNWKIETVARNAKKRGCVSGISTHYRIYPNTLWARV